MSIENIHVINAIKSAIYSQIRQLNIQSNNKSKATTETKLLHFNSDDLKKISKVAGRKINEQDVLHAFLNHNAFSHMRDGIVYNGMLYKHVNLSDATELKVTIAGRLYAEYVYEVKRSYIEVDEIDLISLGIYETDDFSLGQYSFRTKYDTPYSEFFTVKLGLEESKDYLFLDKTVSFHDYAQKPYCSNFDLTVYEYLKDIVGCNKRKRARSIYAYVPKVYEFRNMDYEWDYLDTRNYEIYDEYIDAAYTSFKVLSKSFNLLKNDTIETVIANVHANKISSMFHVLVNENTVEFLTQTKDTLINSVKEMLSMKCQNVSEEKSELMLYFAQKIVESIDEAIDIYEENEDVIETIENFNSTLSLETGKFTLSPGEYQLLLEAMMQAKDIDERFADGQKVHEYRDRVQFINSDAAHQFMLDFKLKENPEVTIRKAKRLRGHDIAPYFTLPYYPVGDDEGCYVKLETELILERSKLGKYLQLVK